MLSIMVGRAALVATFCLSFLGAGPVYAQTTAEMDDRLDFLFGDHAHYAQFFAKLKEAVATDDRETVAAMIDYPFQTRIEGKATTISDRSRFVADYGRIITSEVRDAVAQQTYATLFANWQGVMVGNGQIWFGGKCSDNSCVEQTVRIIAINN